MEETETERTNLSDTITNKIKFFNIDDINKTLGFSDTISLLKSIDLLITIDTAIVHLAGVLGVKTWLLLGYGSDWRWMKEEKTTCWYTSVELVRMTENKELYTILDKVKEKLLLELCSCKSASNSPISISGMSICASQKYLQNAQ